MREPPQLRSSGKEGGAGTVLPGAPRTSPAWGQRAAGVRKRWVRRESFRWGVKNPDQSDDAPLVCVCFPVLSPLSFPTLRAMLFPNPCCWCLLLRKPGQSFPGEHSVPQVKSSLIKSPRSPQRWTSCSVHGWANLGIGVRAGSRQPSWVWGVLPPW